MLTSSTVAENDFPVWVSGTTYAVDDKRIRTETHRIYQRLTAGAGTTPPESDPTNWVDIGPTNRWAMFDNVVGTVTTGTSPLTVTIQPGSIGGLAAMELVGTSATITMKDAPGGTTVYSRTVDLDGSMIDSIYDWFFAEQEQRADFVLTDLPAAFTGCELTMTITASSGNVSCGVFKVGPITEIGRTQAGAQVRTLDYSRKEADAFGYVEIVERPFRKMANFSVVTDAARFNSIYRFLTSRRAKPSIFIGSEKTGLEPLLVYGFMRDFSIDVAYFSHHLCSLELEGLI
jgi:hypothetical protein